MAEDGRYLTAVPTLSTSTGSSTTSPDRRVISIKAPQVQATAAPTSRDTTSRHVRPTLQSSISSSMTRSSLTPGRTYVPRKADKQAAAILGVIGMSNTRPYHLHCHHQFLMQNHVALQSSIFTDYLHSSLYIYIYTLFRHMRQQ